MEPLSIGLALLQYVPELVKYFTGSEKDKDVATTLVDVAKKITTKGNGEEALAELKVSPEAVLQFRKASLDLELELEKLATANASDINATMVAEGQSEYWPQYSWRPAIGFSIALAVVLSVATVFIAYAAAIFSGNTKGLEYLPAILAAVMGIIAAVSPILGIASWFRGKKQVTEVQ